MDSYIAPAVLAYILTGLLSVEGDLRSNPSDAPAYVHKRSMRMLVRIAWPVLKPKWLFWFAMSFVINYLIYIIVSDYFDEIFWRSAFTWAISFPVMFLMFLIMALAMLPLLIVSSIINFIFARNKR